MQNLPRHRCGSPLDDPLGVAGRRGATGGASSRLLTMCWPAVVDLFSGWFGMASAIAPVDLRRQPMVSHIRHGSVPGRGWPSTTCKSVSCRGDQVGILICGARVPAAFSGCGGISLRCPRIAVRPDYRVAVRMPLPRGRLGPAPDCLWQGVISDFMQ